MEGNHFRCTVDFLFRLVFAVQLILKGGHGCLQVIPSDDMSTTEPLQATPATSSSASTSTTAQSCLVGTVAYGTFSPAPGSTIPEGSTAVLTCIPAAHTGTGSVVTAVCFNGALSPTSPCLPCPDSTWVYDSTTNRCFKTFNIGYGANCDFTPGCAAVASQYGVPGSIAYTLNIPTLVDALLIGLSTNPVLTTYVGIGDPVANNYYVLADGTPVPFLSLVPFFLTHEPNDVGINLQQYVTYQATGFLDNLPGFNDNYCTPGYGTLCRSNCQ